MITTTQAILLGFVLFITFGGNWLLGQSMLDRPIVVSPLVGIVLGKPQEGVIIGAALEALFMGAVNIGGAAPVNPSFGALLATSFAIATGGGTETALALAMPIGLFGGALETVSGIVLSLFVDSAENYAREGDIKKITQLHFGLWFLKFLSFSVIATILIKIGLVPVKNIMDKLPEWIIHGLHVAGGLLPGLGFGMLLKLLWHRNLAVYYFLGFILAAYFEVPLVALAIIGFIIVFIVGQQEKMILESQAIASGSSNLGEVKDLKKQEEEDFFNV